MNSLSSAFFYSFLALANAAEVRVRDAAEFRAAVSSAQPGTRILLAPGSYGGGHHFVNLRGAAEMPIIIAAEDPKSPPVFSDKSLGIHLSRPAYVELRGLSFTKLSGNGLNIDNGGGTDESARHIVLHGLRVSDIGGQRNEDGIKLSGISDFRVEDCVVERWGAGGGSGIDMVGCHRGVI